MNEQKYKTGVAALSFLNFLQEQTQVKDYPIPETFSHDGEDHDTQKLLSHFSGKYFLELLNFRHIMLIFCEKMGKYAGARKWVAPHTHIGTCLDHKYRMCTCTEDERKEHEENVALISSTFSTYPMSFHPKARANLRKERGTG